MINNQSLTHWGRDKMDAILQTTFSNAFSSMKMFEFQLKFHWSLFLGTQLTMFQHWLRLWRGTDYVTNHYLNQWWLVCFVIFWLHEWCLMALCELLTHIHNINFIGTAATSSRPYTVKLTSNQISAWGNCSFRPSGSYYGMFTGWWHAIGMCRFVCRKWGLVFEGTSINTLGVKHIEAWIKWLSFCK